jgi:hypothetical protein
VHPHLDLAIGKYLALGSSWKPLKVVSSRFSGSDANKLGDSIALSDPIRDTAGQLIVQPGRLGPGYWI